MSYGLSAPLQAAVFHALSVDAPLSAIIGANLFDALPSGPLPTLYVTLGDERVRDASDQTGHGAWHDLTVSVVTEAAGFQAAKEAAGAVSDVLHDAQLSMSRGHMVSLRFRKAQARRQRGGVRRIDLIFRARLEAEAA